ncbi:hypothetical protein, partial [Streptomyces sp. NPDC053431]|uniref:hypothetical protein n=1 Tax=Streptomyces sp. NPDC053431 TaxID=3365703 RepID=UPI0037D70887
MSDALVRMPTTFTAEAHARTGGRTWLYDFAWQGPPTSPPRYLMGPEADGSLPVTRSCETSKKSAAAGFT